MKVVNKKEFLALPPGVIYAKIEPCVFDAICIKHETRGDDWYYSELLEVKCKNSGEFADIIFDAIEYGTKIPLDFNTMSRDGLQVETQKFAIFEKSEVKELILMLAETLQSYPEI